MAARGRQYWSDSRPGRKQKRGRGRQMCRGPKRGPASRRRGRRLHRDILRRRPHDVRSEDVGDRRTQRYESPAGDDVRPWARPKLRLRDRRRRVGGLRGRAPPPRRHRRHRSLTRGGRTRRRRRQPLEPAAVGGESRLALRLGRPLRAEPARRSPRHPLSLGKVLGGSGRINAMVWARGHRADYEDWAEAGNTGWDFHSVLPLFKQAEDWEDGESEFRGAGGPIRVERAKKLHPATAAFIDAGRSYGMPYLDDMNVPEPEGVGPMNLNVRDGIRCSPADAYLWPVMANQNLTVLTEALALKLRFTGSQCTGLDFLLDGKLRSVGASSELILCAGAIHSPRLLLLSGIGPHADLTHLGIETLVDLPGVGQNLQDHVWIRGLCFEAKHPLPAPNNNLGGTAC